MKTALDKIIDYKRDEVAELKKRSSLTALLSQARDTPEPRGFSNALQKVADNGRNALICELKRKSPSAGEIMPGANPVEIARDYEAGGAACLSVLTDLPSFGGSLDDLVQIRNAVKLPILRKEFMVDEIQVAEARAYGADAILVILSVLDDSQAKSLINLSEELGMDAIIEVHDRAELDRANNLPGKLVGINNRDLKRMVTDLSTTEKLAPHLAEGKMLISESGISSPEHIARLRKTGARRFLIGESLMKSDDRQAACETLSNAKHD
ncbi:indole-3-glycerol phosphate synthase TrpC [Henriciella litoralis]|uniref:indole-3-glycerol phosphate synthase TrpC n=1 Tax=Henriciella litoralis TaxID=568102 RepID=UPI000A05AEF8|nr:indole-3-glycerol phosphate synthase TrpC [Henriciella litoralis]